MIDMLVQLLVWLSTAANLLGRYVFAPVGLVPGWLSATVIATVTGVLLLAVFKYTSNQAAIRRVRNDIDAHLLALKLFKDSARVALRAQGRILVGAGRLFVLALVPMLAMVVPVTLLLGQLGLWYQARPLKLGEESVITLKLGGQQASPLPAVSMQPTPAVDVTVGPVRVQSKREVCWRVKARERGSHRLVFDVAGQTCDKQLAVGDGLMWTSALRPGWQWSDILLNPGEAPFRPGSPVQSIAIDYPARSSWTSGTDSWVIYWFVVSMIAALCFRRVLGVHV